MFFTNQGSLVMGKEHRLTHWKETTGRRMELETGIERNV